MISEGILNRKAARKFLDITECDPTIITAKIVKGAMRTIDKIAEEWVVSELMGQLLLNQK